MSTEFWTAFMWTSICVLVGGVVAGVYYVMKHNRSEGHNDPEDMALWVKPLVVFGGVASLWGDMVASINGWVLFAVAFVVGLIVSLASIGPARYARDVILAAISGIVSVILVIARLSAGGDISIVYLVLLAALAAGLAFGGIKKVLDPVRWIALLGGLQVVDYLFSPWGLENFPGINLPMLTIGVVGAIVFGLLIRLQPEFVIILSGVSITLLGVFLQVLLWFESKNYPGSVTPDWTVAIVWGGLLIGYAIKSVPYAMAARLGTRRF